jgi:hypothetical protein
MVNIADDILDDIWAGKATWGQHTKVHFMPLSREQTRNSKSVSKRMIPTPRAGYRQRLSRAVGRCGRARVLVTQGPHCREAATSAEPLKSSAL